MGKRYRRLRGKKKRAETKRSERERTKPVMWDTERKEREIV